MIRRGILPVDKGSKWEKRERERDPFVKVKEVEFYSLLLIPTIMYMYCVVFIRTFGILQGTYLNYASVSVLVGEWVSVRVSK